MIRFKFVAATLGAVALVVGAGGIAQASPPPHPSASTGSSASTNFLNDTAANFSAGVVTDALNAQFADDAAYAGAFIDESGVTVSFAAPATAAETSGVQVIEQSAAGVPVTVDAVDYSLGQLDAIVDQLNEDQPLLASMGFTMSYWGENTKTDRVEVHVVGPSPDAATTFSSRYGGAVDVVTEAPAVAASSRTADGAPWWGGDKIVGPSASCTSWFSTIAASGASVSPTAGHCGTGAWTQNGHTFGTVTTRHFGGSMDGELIPVSTNSSYVWANPGATSRTVTGLGMSDSYGNLVCTDGYANNEVCDVMVTDINVSTSYDGQTITGLVEAVQQGAQSAFSAGDSGGPVYALSGSNAIARGMVEARIVGFDDTGFYMPARTVDSYFNVFVRTS